jgi:hypothetical protein
MLKSTLFLLFTLCTFCTFYITTTSALPTVNINTNSNGSYTISVNSNVWFVSNDVWFTVNHQKLSVADGTLKLTSFDKQTNATNSIGQFNSYIYLYTSQDGNYMFNTIISVFYSLAIEGNVYTDPSNVRAITFTQTYITAASQTNTVAQNVMSAFPSFDTSSSQLTTDLGYVNYCGIFSGDRYGKYSGKNANIDFCSNGLESGPFLIFDEQTAAMVSPVTQFMSTSIVYNKNSIDIGFMGGITEVPAYTVTETIIYFDDRGVTETILNWGDILLTVYEKPRENIYAEFTTNYIGYNTDNGAYYYYNPIANETFESTLYKVKDYALTEEIPFRFMWLDSWWYFKDHGPYGGGTVNWTAMPSVFPSGLVDLHTNLEWPFIAHNRFWSPNTTYATKNGGNYNFILEEQFALPTEQKFWDDLLSTAAAWGVRIYEQDWLITEFENLNALQSSVSLGRTWLRQMGAGAEKNGINIQYCMPLPRHALQSVEIPSVVQIRASGDYQPGNDQWQIGATSLFNYALGIAPFKDDFWTTKDQPGNPYHLSESAPMLEAVIATLSTGPVTPSDGIGYANTTIISHIVRKDGLILKPDRPATLVDRAFNYRALQTQGPDGQVMHTYTRYPSTAWHIVLAADVKSEFDLTNFDIHSDEKYFVFEMDALGNFPVNFQSFDPATPLHLVPNTKETFSLFHFAPVLSNGMILVGEAGKFVKMSKRRVNEVIVLSDVTVLTVHGDAAETVTFEYLANQLSTSLSTAQCTCDDSGRATVMIFPDGHSLCAY